MTLAPGFRLGPYEVLALLGKGGMGEVWRARDSRLGRDVAIKVLPQALAADPDRLARFEREARSVAALNHPNIVTLYSIEEADGVRFLTMELVEGEALDQLVVPGGMPLGRVLDLGIPLADALSAAHQKGIVHRDLKPANVMVSRDGRVKVLDFGLAKAEAETAALGMTAAPTLDAPISGVGVIVGTVPYMAPEQLRGAPVDARTDLFSLGILLYELSTGKRPFTGASAVEVSSGILRDPPAPPRSVRGDLPPDLDRIIERCLAKDPERRVQTAKDVRNELEHLRRVVGPDAAPPKRERRTPPTAESEAPSIAVLPFVNRSASADDEYFSDGLADELISVLVKIKGLRVAARTSSATFKGRSVTIEEAGRVLNVRSVLEGSVRKAGNRVRISVQLVRVEDGVPLWSETYDRTLDDIFAVQDDIARSVVKELRTTLLGEAPDSDASGAAQAEVAAAAQGRGGNPEAHRLYLEGRHFVDQFTREGVMRGVDRLEAATALDPTNALALATLARAYWFAGAYGFIPVTEGYEKAKATVARALEIVPDLPEALLVRAMLAASHEFDFRTAGAALERAYELAPGNPLVLDAYGQFLTRMGRFEEARPIVERALEQDPLSPTAWTGLAGLERVTGRYAQAEAATRRILELSPDRAVARHMLAYSLALQGRHDEARREAEREPLEWARLTALASIDYRAGRVADADRSLERLIEIGGDDCAFQVGALYAQRGQADEAFRWLDHALATRDAGVVLARFEPSFRLLHGDPRWPVFLRKVGFDV